MEIMMALLLGILISLAAIFICAVVVGLRRRRRRGAPGSHDVSSAARAARAAADARGVSRIGPPDGMPGGGIGPSL